MLLDHDRQEPQRACHALDRRVPALDEMQAGTRDQIVDDAGHQHLAGGGAGRHALGHVQSETRDRSVADIDLAGMHAGRERKLELFRGLLERECAADRPRAPVEARPDRFAARFDQMTAVAGDGLRRLFAQAIDALMPKLGRRAWRRAVPAPPAGRP